jgi:diacylglycerol kinase (ATP)
MAGIGFDAEVVAHLDLALKRRAGKLAYVWSILGRLRHYRPCFYRAEVDGTPVEGASLVAARAHFYGGRFVLAPAARLEDRRMEVVVFGHGGRGAALGYMAAMGLGVLQHCRGLRIVPGQSVRLFEPAGAPVQLDGDIQLHLPARLRLATTPLRLITPEA